MSTDFYIGRESGGWAVALGGEMMDWFHTQGEAMDAAVRMARILLKIDQRCEVFVEGEDRIYHSAWTPSDRFRRVTLAGRP